MTEAKERVHAVWFVGIFMAAVAVRWLASADHNLAEDPFVIVESAKHLLQTGLYRIPSIGAASGEVAWSMPSWPAGFPVLLVAAFKLFGALEAVARSTTIVVSAFLPPITVQLAYLLTGRRRVALLAGGLSVLHPLAVAFAGQIFTNNISVTLFAAWLTVLLAAATDRERGAFLRFDEIVTTPRRRTALVVAAFLFGLAISVRDTDVLLAGLAAYILYRTGAFSPRTIASSWRTVLLVLAAAVVAFAIGWTPGWYLNLVNFGSPFVSAHYATGIRLSARYLFEGSDAFFGLPGLAVMAIAIAVFQFPVLLAFGAVARRGLLPAAAVLTALVALPLLLVNGAFPVASNGAAPRYVLPLVPFACLFAADLIDRALRRSRRLPTVAMAMAVLGWQMLLYFPPPELFKTWPRFAYLAYYSPVYVARPYHNYPDHTNAMVRWVKAHTPANALVITPSRSQHFFYYGQRNVCILDALTPVEWAIQVARRPVYFVEDRNLALQRTQVTELRLRLADVNLRLVEEGEVEIFTPEAGLVQMFAYRALPIDGPRTSP